jgi:hypothetical protein
MRRRNDLMAWSRVSFWGMSAVLAILWLSGLVMQLMSSVDMSDISVMEEGFRRATWITHGVASWLFCVMCGRGVWPHVRWMWHRHSCRRRWRWLMGLLNLGWLLLLAVGGLLLLYGSTGMHELIVSWHFWLGALGPLIFLPHTWNRLRSQATSA